MMASPHLSNHYMYKSTHKVFLPDPIQAHEVAYIGEGLVDIEGLETLEEMDMEERPRHRRDVLDHYAIDVGEKYLNDIYKEDESPPDSRTVETPSSNGLTDRAQTEKELAWRKVRQLLLEEEKKASSAKKAEPTSSKKRVSSRLVASGDEREDRCDTVKLLDAMATTTSPNLYHATTPHHVRPKIARSLDPPAPSFTSHLSSRLAHFLQGASPTDGTNASFKSLSSHASSSSSSHPGATTPTRWMLLATLEQVTKTCQEMDLSDASVARVSVHLAAIDQVLRDELTSHKRQAQHSSTDSTEYESYPVLSIPSDAARESVAPTVKKTFKEFAAAQDLTDTLATFHALVADCGLEDVRIQEPWHLYYRIRDAVYPKLGFVQKQLFKLLNVRLGMDVYRRRPAASKRVCIVGAGPVGLRAAVELALLGAQVSVLEKRTKFSRENMLHLWPWVVQDLASLGAKILLKNFCKSRTYFHVSTRQLQMILLKVALLLGVKIYAGTGFEAIVPPEADASRGHSFYSIQTSPQIPVVEFTAVLGASGTNNLVAKPAGIHRFVFCRNESLGIVCYYPNLETPDETKMKEFSWTKQLKHAMLSKMRDVGIDLENIVYFRGEMHYLVMTPKRRNLLEHEVVKKNYADSQDLVRNDNINPTALYDFVNRIIKFVGIARKTEIAHVNLFDFSQLTRADQAARILHAHGKKLYVGLMGDSLLEPVWHEGVGTCRGFLSALDGVWMIAEIGRKCDDQLLADRAVAYQVMQRLSGQHRLEMQKNVRKYTVDPRSRYIVSFPQVTC
ncbi:hypothetical protein PsorP6_010271 [Peronosclerospora sorghi]|uniref:Uncharacterized protein n=1 Tax=Peronosclerospora sorghi TaxID=230839 RepID=A0ACC0VTB3_9STRA|nr:hypothetical protein PsorP6_010271 [Peronosclerospora sorghi]